MCLIVMQFVTVDCSEVRIFVAVYYCVVLLKSTVCATVMLCVYHTHGVDETNMFCLCGPMELYNMGLLHFQAECHKK